MQPKLIYTTLLLTLCFGCGPNDKHSITQTDTDVYKKRSVDSTVAPKDVNETIDTSGLSNAPIKIIKSSLKELVVDTVDEPEDNLHHEGHFKRFVNIKIVYKNVSSKRITEAHLKWLVVDKNGQPAPIESNRSGIGTGKLVDVPVLGDKYSLGIHKTATDEWQQNCKNGVKIKLAFPYKVKFYDGTTWEIGK